MLRFAWRGLVARGGRSLVLGLAVLVASCAFAVLTASSHASRLTTIGIVRDNVSAYDILVRPAGARSRLERSDGLVQPGFLSAVYGGISLQQWHRIQELKGVAVAAPIAILGYAYPSLSLPVDTTGAWAKAPGADALARVQITWRGDNGLTVTRATPDYALITASALRFNEGAPAEQGTWLVHRRGVDRDICPGSIPEDVRPESRPSVLNCFSRTEGGLSAITPEYRALQGVREPYPLSYVVAAVDPASEDALFGLDEARTSGKSLLDAPLDYPGAIDQKGVPVMVADGNPGVDESATVKVSSLPAAAARLVMQGRGPKVLARFKGTVVHRYRVTAQQAHALLLDAFRTAQPVSEGKYPSRGLPGEISLLAHVGEPRLTARDGRWHVRLSKPTTRGAINDQMSQAPDSDDWAARAVTTSQRLTAEGAGTPPIPATLRLRGTFDPTRLKGVGDVTNQILSGYATAVTAGQDQRSKDLLGSRPLRASTNIAGLVQPPPTMITTLAALPELQASWSNTNSLAPISAIRVKVTDADITSKKSREQIRLIAQQIHDKTGLDVDITTGSSTTTKTIELPAGRHGRPQLLLSQDWVKKGVATHILSAVDKKSVALFLLVLVVSALTVANAAVATIRAQRTELGVLACLGWRRGQLFTSVAYELGIVATVAGLVGFPLALWAGHLVGTDVSVLRAALTLPASFAVVLVAGAVPAYLAARADPMDAVRPVVDEPRRPRHARGIAGMAALNMTTSRARTALAALGLAVAVTTSTVLLGIVLGFQGAVVGTVLGDSVAIQARTADYAATIAILVLACLGVSTVMYLNIRERGTELATLRAVGWTERQLASLITFEGLLVGVAGTTPGALIGLGAAAALTGQLTIPMLTGCLLAWAVATSCAALAAYAATGLVRRLPTADLLSE